MAAAVALGAAVESVEWAATGAAACAVVAANVAFTRPSH
jgi:hypothetical protein